MNRMDNISTRAVPGRQRAAGMEPGLGVGSAQHYLRLIVHRKWLVAGVFLVISLVTVLVAARLPDVYTSETVILVDPQKVPEGYVKSTVTGDVRNRLGTLSQQILSATRLQKIIDTLRLYPEDKKTLPREEIITRMRRDISVKVLSDFGGSQDLQAFRITYSGREPRLVAQVTNELASLFIEENLKAREQQATGTTEFLENQLQETRKALESQEAKLRDFKLKHIGEMPEQQTAGLQILGQLQSQLQLESDALSRAEQQKSYIQSMVAQSSAPVVDLDDGEQNGVQRKGKASSATLSSSRAKLAQLLAIYTENHPDVQRMRRVIKEEEAQGNPAEAVMRALYTEKHPDVKRYRKQMEAKGENETATSAAESDAAQAVIAAPSTQTSPAAARPAPPSYVNPVLQSQLKMIDAEIAKHQEEQQRLSKLVASNQAKLEAVPLREQEITSLVRDYEISKAHYSQLLEKQLSAETATQLEIRQKGERFSILDPAQPAERPSKPNRTLINVGGGLAGLLLGLLAALGTELIGTSITAPEQITAATTLPVLEIIPSIRTSADRLARRRRLLFTAGSAAAAVIVCCGLALYHYHS